MSFHLICFGDSLTAGYQSGGVGDASTPYGAFLRSWLGPRGRVQVSGICGEMTHEMTKRFHRDVVTHRPTAVVILGGTNDLGGGMPPSSIVQNLETLYRQALDAGIQAVGVTVPSLYPGDPAVWASEERADNRTHQLPQWIQSHLAQRRLLNGMILDRCRGLPIPFVDLFRETIEGPHDLLAPSYSSDGLHLSTRGYERFAELVWKVLFEKSFGAPLRREENR